jgi:hypothetical protein
MKMVLTGVVLAAGCSSPPAVTRASVNSCFQFAVGAIQRHVTVTTVPTACQGLSQLEVNVVVSRALQATAAGVGGKVAQRQLIARDGPYVTGLIHAVPRPARMRWRRHSHASPAATPSAWRRWSPGWLPSA